MLRMLAAAFAALTVSQVSFSFESRDVANLNLKIIPGNSHIEVPLQPPQWMTQFQILYVPSKTCTQFQVAPQVKYVGLEQWYDAPYNGSVFVTADRETASLLINFKTPPNGGEQICQIMVKALSERPDPLPPAADPIPPAREPEPSPAPQPEPAPEPTPEPEPAPGPPEGSQWLRAGVLNFPGGAHKQGNLGLNGTYLAQDIGITIPPSCINVSMEEVGIFSGGTYVKATPASDRPGVYYLQRYTSFTGVGVTVTGPEGATCPIEVYLYGIKQ